MIPSFILRKLYKKHSLRETGPGKFAFALQNPLTNATIVAPPEVTVNGIHYGPAAIGHPDIDFASISTNHPLLFRKGDVLEMRFEGHLMRGANRIAIDVLTQEFGELELFFEEREATFCDMPGEEE